MRSRSPTFGPSLEHAERRAGAIARCPRLPLSEHRRARAIRSPSTLVRALISSSVTPSHRYSFSDRAGVHERQHGNGAGLAHDRRSRAGRLSSSASQTRRRWRPVAGFRPGRARAPARPRPRVRRRRAAVAAARSGASRHGAGAARKTAALRPASRNDAGERVHVARPSSSRSPLLLGLMYSGVPMPARPRDVLSASLTDGARDAGSRRAPRCPSASSTFSGFTSRWTNPSRWRNRARTQSRAMPRASLTGPLLAHGRCRSVSRARRASRSTRSPRLAESMSGSTWGW